MNISIAGLSNRLSLDEHGIWTSAKSSPVSYPKDGHYLCLPLEDSSYWFKHRNDCILAAIKRFPPAGAILDVGGGNGYVTRRLLDDGFDTVLLEPGVVGALNAKTARRIPEVICSTLEAAEFAQDSLSAIGVFDVLEHIDDDRAFVDHIHRLLQPDGLLYATVPAHQWLWSLSDVSAQHFRRYNRTRFGALLGGKFEPLFFTYFFGALTFPVLLLRTIPFRLGIVRQGNILPDESEHGTSAGPASRFLATMLKTEVDRINAGRVMRIGTSCLCIARKRTQEGSDT
jgi:SAM-dependent methyltransferase